MENPYIKMYGHDPFVVLLGNDGLMFRVWLGFTFLIGITTLLLGNSLFSGGSAVAMTALVFESVVTVKFGLYRSLFYNTICAISVGAVLLLAAASFLGSQISALPAYLQMLALLFGCYAFVGVYVVTAMKMQR